jgi:WD40 repeat protein
MVPSDKAHAASSAYSLPPKSTADPSSSPMAATTWNLLTGNLVRQGLRGHIGPVTALTTTELHGRPVIISGSDDQTVRVRYLATGAPFGQPLNGHTGEVHELDTAEVDGRPVVISSSRDETIRRRDLVSRTST